MRLESREPVVFIVANVPEERDARSNVRNSSLIRQELPTYDQAINETSPPPSYESIFGKIHDVHQRSDTVWVFLKNILILLLGTSTFKS